jgi:phosphoribosylformylglycinamidine synthase
MKKHVTHLYRSTEKGISEACFNIETNKFLTEAELKTLKWLLAETFESWNLSTKSSFAIGTKVVEVGPRLNVATPFNTNALSILKSCGLDEKITRLEVSRRIAGEEAPFDRMTECIYPEPLKTFSTGQVPEEVYYVNLLKKGLAAFDEIDGLSMGQDDKQAYYDYFVGRCNRNPTIVEIMDLNNANSEHSRHGYFKGKQVIDGVEMPETLMDIVKSTFNANPNNSLVAFRDNSSVLEGFDIWTLIPGNPGQASKFVEENVTYHLLFTAETHNFPTGVAPFPGAQTGTGGRVRDVQATGRGGLVIAGTAGYAIGNLLLKDYNLPWEQDYFPYPENLASAKDILIFGSNGTTRYGNEFGEPVIQGFVRAGASCLPDGTRYEWLKPILFTGGIGQIHNDHLEKEDAEKGMIIIEIGGPAYRIGFGGGAASSLMQGENKSELDFNAVQRGDAEMEQKMNRVVRACIEMGANNPIVSIHDQGAGGPANVLKELVEHAGGRINIRNINSGDPTLSVLEIWVCEFQERNGLLIRPKQLELFKSICEREKVNCEILGEVTGDGIFTVYDSNNPGENPVEMELNAVLGGMPQKTFSSENISLNLKPFNISEARGTANGLTGLERVLRLPSVGSKRFLTNKGDRSVTGLIAQQQCCGWPQLTVSDVAIIAQSHFRDDKGTYTGAAISIGEQPIKMLVNPEAGARMAVAEAITNMACALIYDIESIKCSANWMAAPKLPGEGARMYKAATAMRDFMIELGIAVDGGKDSLSMATKVHYPLENETKLIKSPMELVISAYAPMPDITKKVTPDVKKPGGSYIMRIDVSGGKRRLGGSALAQVFGQLGDECPDVDPKKLLPAFYAIQAMIDRELILSCHDISDGGMIVTLLEMLFAGNCGFKGGLNIDKSQEIPELFAEEVGWLIEYLPENEDKIVSIFADIIGDNVVDMCHRIGETSSEAWIKLYNLKTLLPIVSDTMENLRSEWEMTSHQLDKLQCNPKCVEEERQSISTRQSCPYTLSFTPEKTKPEILELTIKSKVAIIREEGSNGDREMASYFAKAGFEVWDVNMYDLINKKVDLANFRGVVFVGGFSYADVLDSAKGWAATILFNKELKKMFDKFYARPDTFSLSVCNGCQLAALLGWVPFKGMTDVKKARFIKNESGRFESRFLTVKVLKSDAIMLKNMAGSVLGIWSAHGEGRFYGDKALISVLNENQMAPIRYVDDYAEITERYPFNPNGSPLGIAGICDESGRHLAMMPHPERTFLKWQWAYMPEQWKQELKASPWLKMTQNAYDWCEKNK